MVMLLAPLTGASAQSEEPVVERLSSALKRDYASFGALLQTVAEWQPDRPSGTDGFRIPNFRMLLSGRLDRGLGYAFQANLVSAPSILDARLYVDLASWISLDVGQFKAPFSRELLTYAGALDFADRSQVVSSLAPSRQLGAQARVRVSPSVEWMTGIFNGNGIAAAGNEDDAFVAVGRVQWTPPLGDSSLSLAVSAARSTANESSPGGAFLSAFVGQRALLGADMRWTNGSWLIAAEGVWAKLDPVSGATTNPAGFYVTAGRATGERTMVLIRWDAFDADLGGRRNDVVVLGMDWHLSSVGLFRINWLMNARDEPGRHRWVAGAQLGF